ncbi:MAG: hypothetical protein QW390_03110 [Candidatus Bathyarchaeia archaeon]
MNFRAGVLYAEGAPSYGVDLSSVTPRRWADSFEEIGAETDYIQPREFERLAEILDYDVIANPYGGVLPEHGAHLVTAGLRTFTEEGGLFLEVMPPPFYLCYFS